MGEARRERPDGIEAISAVTLATHAMPPAVRFYLALGFALRYGGPAASFSSFSAGNACLNLILEARDRHWSWWGRVIFYVADVDAVHQQALAAGLEPHDVPRDATWGERYFHITDSDGHELSFATPLGRGRG